MENTYKNEVLSGGNAMKCWSEEILDKLPSSRLVFVKHEDGSYHPAIIESINEDGTVTVIESNKK